MKKIVSTITMVALSLCIVPFFSGNVGAEYTITYQSENAPEIDKSQRTSFYLTDDTAAVEVTVPAQNEDGKLYTSANILCCSAVETILLGENVYYIYIEDCPNLKEIHIDEANPYFSEVDGVVYNEEMTELLFYFRNKEDKSFTVPETVTTIYDYAFSGNQYLEEVVIPEGVTVLGQYAFAECNLTKAELPHSLEKIGVKCFTSNLKLADITIPEKIARLDYVFENCEALETVTFLNPDEIYNPLSAVGGDHLFAYANAFGDRSNPITAYVPDNQLEQYDQMAQDGWGCEYEIIPLSQKPVADPQPTGIAGDVNCDGCCNIADLVIVSRWILSSNDLASNMNDLSACDMDLDGAVGALDLIMLRSSIISGS